MIAISMTFDLYFRSWSSDVHHFLWCSTMLNETKHTIHELEKQVGESWHCRDCHLDSYLKYHQPGCFIGIFVHCFHLLEGWPGFNQVQVSTKASCSSFASHNFEFYACRWMIYLKSKLAGFELDVFYLFVLLTIQYFGNSHIHTLSILT